jgi:hypothetical protein
MRNGHQRKLVAIYDRVLGLAVDGKFAELQKVINVIAKRSHAEVRLSAEFATAIVLRASGNVIDRSPLMSQANEFRELAHAE